MRKNLVIGCVGPTSLHKNWIGENREFDLCLVNYGKNPLHETECEYLGKAKGTKFNIVGNLDIPKGYDYIFVPDDDLYISATDINRLFEYAADYKLDICQPSLMGYYSIPLNLHHPGFILRYTNYVEIICPCFSSEAFEKCKPLFNYNKSCWGIEKLWDLELKSPKDKIAIIDDVVVVHTRPCFKGDNYSNNSIESPWQDISDIIDKYNLEWAPKQYGSVLKDVFETPHHERCYPPMMCVSKMCKTLFEDTQKKSWI